MTVAGVRPPRATSRNLAWERAEPCQSVGRSQTYSPWGCENECGSRLAILPWREDGSCFARQWAGGLTIWSSAASEASPLQRRVRRRGLRHGESRREPKGNNAENLWGGDTARLSEVVDLRPRVGGGGALNTPVTCRGQKVLPRDPAQSIAIGENERRAVGAN